MTLPTAQMTPLTPEAFLRKAGLRDDELAELLPEFTRRMRIVNGLSQQSDTDEIREIQLAEMVLDEQTITICRNCEEVDTIDEEGDCLDCGFGVVNKADRPAGRRVASTGLPIHMSAGETATCSRCGGRHHPELYRVRVPNPPLRFVHLCRGCASADPEYRAWQLFCDLTVAIDALMQAATDQQQRDLIASQIGNTATWFAGWRGDNEPGAVIAELANQGNARRAGIPNQCLRCEEDDRGCGYSQSLGTACCSGCTHGASEYLIETARLREANDERDVNPVRPSA